MGALGHGEVYQDHETQDDIESRDLYHILEKEVAPLFYQQGPDGIPMGWVEKMRSGLRHLAPIFNAHRMVQEYVSRYYLPCSKRFNTLCSDEFAGAKDLAAWRKELMTKWHEVSVEEVTYSDGLEMSVGQQVDVMAWVRLGNPVTGRCDRGCLLRPFGPTRGLCRAGDSSLGSCGLGRWDLHLPRSDSLPEDRSL